VTTVESAPATPVILGALGRTRQAHVAQGPLVGLTGGHRLGTHYLRRLRHVGGVLQQELLRGRGHAPQPDLAVLFAMPHRELRARQPPGNGDHLVDDLTGPADPDLPARLPVHLLLLPPRVLPLLLVGAPACAVADAHVRYTGESRFPLIVQNVHRYFFYFGLIFNVILTIDAVGRFSSPVSASGSPWDDRLVLNAGLLWLYSLSCHACRHLCGGGMRTFSEHPIRYRFWKFVTPLNARHMQFAWMSLIVVDSRPVRAPGGQRDHH